MKTLKSITIILGISALTIGSTFAGTNINSSGEVKGPQIGIIANLIQDRVVVSFENISSDPYTVSIVNGKGKTLHSETVLTDGVFHKRYDLGELSDGEYTVKVFNSTSKETSEVLYKNQ